MKILTKYAVRELLNNYFFTLFFICNLTLGLLGFIFLGNARISVGTYFDYNLQKILNGDFEIYSAALLPADIEPLLDKTLGDTTRRSRYTKLFSMVGGKDNTILFNVFAIDTAYPLYSDFVVDGQAVNPGLIQAQLQAGKNIWIDEAGLELIGSKPGELVKLGNLEWRITGAVSQSPRNGIRFSNLMPAVFISRNHLQASGLLGFGSRLRDIMLFAANPSEDYDRLADQVAAQLARVYGKDAGLEVRKLDHASERLATVIDYVGGFLGLISLVALFLSGVGSAFLFLSYTRKRLKITAIAMCLGLTRRDSFFITLIQLLLLALVSLLLAVLGAGLLSQGMVGFLEEFVTGYQPDFFNLSVIVTGMVIALLSAVLFTAPTFIAIRHLKPLALLKDEPHPAAQSFDWLKRLTAYLPGVLFFWLVAVSLTSLQGGTVFILGLLGAMAAIFGLVSLASLLAEKCSHFFEPLTRIAIRNITRNRNATVSCATATALGVFLISIIPQISEGIRREIETPADSVLPSFFLIDIQEEQLAGVEALVAGEGYALNFVSPMIRAQLKAVNGQAIAAFDKDEEEAEGNIQHEKRRGFNLTYRAALFPSETMVAGRSFQPYAGGEQLAEISVEKKFAARQGLALGDRLLFNIQGLDIEGKIVNLRTVKWNSFQPNFFVSFQPGVLEEAPKTFIGNVRGIPEEEKPNFRNRLVRAYPNISPLDVGKVIHTTMSIAEKSLQAILFLAVLAIFSGLLVIFSVTTIQAGEKKKEMSLLKVMGGQSAALRKYILLEFTAPGVLAAFLGVLFSMVAAAAISHIMFDNIRFLDFKILGSIFAATLVILVSIALYVARQVSRLKPLPTLRAK